MQWNLTLLEMLGHGMTVRIVAGMEGGVGRSLGNEMCACKWKSWSSAATGVLLSTGNCDESQIMVTEIVRTAEVWYCFALIVTVLRL